MAQCQTDHKKHSTSRFDLYGGIFSGQLYGTSAGNGHMDRMHSCPGYNNSASYNVSRFNGDNFAQENLSNGSFREESLRAVIAKTEAADGYGCGVNSMGGLYANGLDRRRSTGGVVQTAAFTPEVSPVHTKNGASKSPPNPKEKSYTPGTPPFYNHSRRTSGEVLNDKNFVKGIPPDGFAFGEIIKGVGNLCEDLSGGGLKSGDLDGSSAGSSKGRSPRAESPKSIGSNSSGGSSSGGSPTVGRIVNFGNILPSGGSMKNGTSPVANSAASISGRGGNSNGGSGHAPVPVPTSGLVKGSRRSNSWDYSSGTVKASHARSGSEVGNGGVYTGANVVVNPRGSLSTSPSGSLGSGYGSHMNGESVKAGLKGYGNIAAEGENLLIRNALSCMDAEEVKNAGNEQYRKGCFTEALNLYDKAITLSPDKAPYRSNRAAALTGLGRLGEAVQECLHAIRLDPSYARAHHRLASLYLRLGQVDNAAKHFKASGTQVEWADTQRILVIEKHLMKCNDARNALDWQALVRETDAAIIAGADSAPQVIACKAEALLKLHRPEEADSVLMNVRRFEDVLKRPSFASTYGIVLFVQAQIDMALGRFDAALAAAEKASQCAPHDSALTIMLRKARTVAKSRKLGNDLFKAGRFAEATTAYGEGLESAPGNAVLLCNRAACRSKLNQWEKAVEDCNAALDAQPSYTKALMRRAQSYAKLERWEDSLRDYEVLRREVPADAEIARALFDVQVAAKKSKGEDTHKIRFGGDVEEVSTNDQFQEAITAPGLAVVEFCTRWSERCKQISPFVDQLCKQCLSINFLKVDVDELPYLAKLENVSFVPTFKIYKNGSKVREICGPTPQALEQAINHFSI